MKNNIKKQFPILDTQINGNPLVYLDGAASSQKPQVVLDALNTAYAERYSNIHSGVHKLSLESTSGIENTREQVAKFVNAPGPDNIVFYSGATEAINQIAWGVRHSVNELSNIVVTIAEHHANILPWQRLCEQTGAELRFVNVLPDGSLDWKDFHIKADKLTAVISVPHVSNVTGTLYPVKEIGVWARTNGSIFVVDGCQGCVHVQTDVQEIDCDFYVASSHKLYGPSGVGFLYGKTSALETMEPLRVGGGAITRVTTDGYTLRTGPQRFEAGTPPIAETAAFGTALEFIQQIAMQNIHDHEIELLDYAMYKLRTIPGIKFVGDSKAKGGVISFYFDDINSVDLATLIAEDGVCIRAGMHCAQPLHDFLNIPTTARASINVHNDESDFDALYKSINKAIDILK